MDSSLGLNWSLLGQILSQPAPSGPCSLLCFYIFYSYFPSQNLYVLFQLQGKLGPEIHQFLDGEMRFEAFKLGMGQWDLKNKLKVGPSPRPSLTTSLNRKSEQRNHPQNYTKINYIKIIPLQDIESQHHIAKISLLYVFI